jgi:hypothetical protein
MLAGELDALVGSFAAEPQLHHPVRGRVSSPMPELPPITTTVCPSSSGSGWVCAATVSGLIVSA